MIKRGLGDFIIFNLIEKRSTHKQGESISIIFMYKKHVNCTKYQ